MKTINIKGKEYTPVNERVQEFHKKYPKGAIQTSIISNEGGIVVIKAVIWPEAENQMRFFTGHASEWQDDARSMVNKTSYVENCETSAIGRALGALGIGIEGAFATSNEVATAERKTESLKCDGCQKVITWPERTYSIKKYNRPLCYACQKLNEPKIEPEKLLDNNGEEIPF